MGTRVKVFKGETSLEVEQEINRWAEANKVRILNASIATTVRTNIATHDTHYAGCIVIVVYEP